MYGMVGGHSLETTERKKKKTKGYNKAAPPKSTASIRAGVILGGAVLGCKLPGAETRPDDLRCGTLDLKQSGRLLNYSDKLTISERQNSFHLNSARDLPALGEGTSRTKPEKLGWKDRFRRKRYDGSCQTSSYEVGGGLNSATLINMMPHANRHDSIGNQSLQSYNTSPIHRFNRYYESPNRSHCSRSDGCSVEGRSRCETPLQHFDSYSNDIRIPMEKDYAEYSWSENRPITCMYPGKCTDSNIPCSEIPHRNSECCIHPCCSGGHLSSKHRLMCRNDLACERFHDHSKFKANISDVPHTNYSDVPIPAAFRSSFSLSDNLGGESSAAASSDACRSDYASNDRHSRSLCKPKLFAKSRSENLLSSLEKHDDQLPVRSRRRDSQSSATKQTRNKKDSLADNMRVVPTSRVCKSEENICADESDGLPGDDERSVETSGRKPPRVSKSVDDLQSQATLTHSSTQTPNKPAEKNEGKEENPVEAARRRKERERRRREAALPFMQRVFLMIKRLSGTEEEGKPF